MRAEDFSQLKLRSVLYVVSQSELAMEGLGFGVWGLGFRVWGLECRI